MVSPEEALKQQDRKMNVISFTNTLPVNSYLTSLLRRRRRRGDGVGNMCGVDARLQITFQIGMPAEHTDRRWSAAGTSGTVTRATFCVALKARINAVEHN